MRIQDIQILDVELQKQFVAYWMNGQYDQALRLLDNNPQLDTKKFTNVVMNQIATSLKAIEEIYHEDFTNALKIELDSFNTTIGDFVYRKEWEDTISYKVGNTVLRADKIYVCIKDNIGREPSDTTYWIYLGLQGDKGGSGIDAVMRYEWNANTDYVVNDIVVYGQYLWCAIQPNKGETPSESSMTWVEFLKVPRAKIITSAVQPSYLYDGMIWFKILNP